MAFNEIIAPMPEPPGNQSLRFRPKYNYISVLTQSPVLPYQFERERQNSSRRSFGVNAVIDSFNLSLACPAKCHMETQTCFHPCAQHPMRRAFVADADGLVANENVNNSTINVLMNSTTGNVISNTSIGPGNASGGGDDGNNDNDDNNGSSDESGTGKTRNHPGDTEGGKNEDSGSNYSNGNNADAGSSDGNGNNGDAGGNPGSSSSEGSGDGSGDGHQDGTGGTGGSDDDEPPGENTPLSDSSEEENLAEFRKYYAIGQPMRPRSTYPIADPLFQRSGEFYAIDFDQMKKKAKKDLPSPSESQLSCVHKWSVEDAAKGCCHACGGWRGQYVFSCSICRALSRPCCTPRWTEVVKARCALTAKRPDEILQPAEVEHRLAEQKRGIKGAAITEWPLVSKRGRYPNLQ